MSRGAAGGGAAEDKIILEMADIIESIYNLDHFYALQYSLYEYLSRALIHLDLCIYRLNALQGKSSTGNDEIGEAFTQAEAWARDRARKLDGRAMTCPAKDMLERIPHLLLLMHIALSDLPCSCMSPFPRVAAIIADKLAYHLDRLRTTNGDGTLLTKSQIEQHMRSLLKTKCGDTVAFDKQFQQLGGRAGEVYGGAGQLIGPVLEFSNALDRLKVCIDGLISFGLDFEDNSNADQFAIHLQELSESLLVALEIPHCYDQSALLEYIGAQIVELVRFDAEQRTVLDGMPPENLAAKLALLSAIARRDDCSAHSSAAGVAHKVLQAFKPDADCSDTQIHIPAPYLAAMVCKINEHHVVRYSGCMPAASSGMARARADLECNIAEGNVDEMFEKTLAVRLKILDELRDALAAMRAPNPPRLRCIAVPIAPCESLKYEVWSLFTRLREMFNSSMQETMELRTERANTAETDMSEFQKKIFELMASTALDAKSIMLLQEILEWINSWILARGAALYTRARLTPGSAESNHPCMRASSVADAGAGAAPYFDSDKFIMLYKGQWNMLRNMLSRLGVFIGGVGALPLFSEIVNGMPLQSIDELKELYVRLDKLVSATILSAWVALPGCYSNDKKHILKYINLAYSLRSMILDTLKCERIRRRTEILKPELWDAAMSDELFRPEDLGGDVLQGKFIPCLALLRDIDGGERSWWEVLPTPEQGKMQRCRANLYGHTGEKFDGFLGGEAGVRSVTAAEAAGGGGAAADPHSAVVADEAEAAGGGAAASPFGAALGGSIFKESQCVAAAESDADAEFSMFAQQRADAGAAASLLLYW